MSKRFRRTLKPMRTAQDEAGPRPIEICIYTKKRGYASQRLALAAIKAFTVKHGRKPGTGSAPRRVYSGCPCNLWHTTSQETSSTRYEARAPRMRAFFENSTPESVLVAPSMQELQERAAQLRAS